MNRLAIALLVVIPVACANAAEVTLNFKGTITSIVDANNLDAPINLPAIPIGSTFSGTVTYDTASPLTNSGTGFSRYVDLLSSSGSLTINGLNFATGIDRPTSAIIVSEESGFGFSGVSFVNQPIDLPNGWSVAASNLPYFTLEFRDAPIKVRSLALPTLGDLQTEGMKLVLDTQQPVTIGGQTYGERVFINGDITALYPPPQEVSIDIDPSSRSNKINLSTKNPKPLKVTVFGSASLDVASIAPDTIALGDPTLTDPEVGTGLAVAPISIGYNDANGDGKLDLLLAFDLLDLQDFGAIDASSKSLELQALLDNEGVVFGSDTVLVSGGKGKGKK